MEATHRHDLPGLSFLSLPREIRDEIYSLALNIPAYNPTTMIHIHPRPTSVGYWNSGPPYFYNAVNCQPFAPNTALLRASRLISAEAAGLLYTKPIFHFGDLDAWEVLHLFLLRIGESGRARLHEIHIHAPTPEHYVRTPRGTLVLESVATNFWPTTDMPREVDPVLRETLDMLAELSTGGGGLKRLQLRILGRYPIGRLEVVREALADAPAEVVYDTQWCENRAEVEEALRGWASLARGRRDRGGGSNRWC
ncbi:hypothetical protein FGG08_002677 [Glutinoglossum americanum]|uniref:Uncharacterized protein n=1 Tax=Glutinoglossum americanum TaxID=1670608 RepID=A0A9P8I8U5_9PEZI|nr:hypothetical protein FGG08_002677 [Glutinoglossum americanum]